MMRSLTAVIASFVVCVAFAALVAVPAFALSPAVETLPAAPVGETTATLNGKVNPNGLETKYFFEYGTTTSYGSKTAEASAGSGSGIAEQSQAINGLGKLSEYHYRIVATNASGMSQGVDQTFRTTAPPVVGTLPPETDPSGEQATLRGFLLPNGLSTTYQFEYGTSSGSYTTTVPIPPASGGSGTTGSIVSYKISGLTPVTKYFYRITASNAAGKSVGSELSFYSSNPPGITPSGVTGVWRTQATAGATIETRSLATSYYLEYGLSASYGSKTGSKEISAGVPTSAAGQTLTALSPGTTYHYRWVATNSAGTAKSADQTFSTLGNATLTFVGGGALKGGSIKAFSSSLSFAGHSCSDAELSGAIGENPGARQEITTVKFQNGEVGCNLGSSLSIKYKNGLNFVETRGLEYAINAAGAVAIRTSPEFNIAATVYAGGIKAAECEYSLSLSGTAKAGTALEPALSGEVKRTKGPMVYCPESGPASGSFAITSEGTALEARP